MVQAKKGRKLTMSKTEKMVKIDFMTKKKEIIVCILCVCVFIGTSLICLSNINILKRPFFQQKTTFNSASYAKYEKDGNIYAVDSGGFRLICMTTDGNIEYVILIDRLKEYARIYDSTIDEQGNLYAYLQEVEYDAFRTKRDIIRKYDKHGNFVKDILVVAYAKDSLDQPHTFPQFGSMHYAEGNLTFSRVRHRDAMLYSYDILTEQLSTHTFFPQGMTDFLIARLCLKDFDNFIYTTRAGDIYEVKNGEPPLLRASFDFTIEDGGMIPWYLDYDSQGNILFMEMISSTIHRIRGDEIERALPRYFFGDLRAGGRDPFLSDFGAFEARFAGVFGDVTWYYNGEEYKTYNDGMVLPLNMRIWIITVQISFILGIASFFLGLYILFIRILQGYVSIFVKQIIFIIPLTVIGFILLYTITFNIMQERINDEIMNNLNEAASLAVELINGDDIENIKSIKDIDSESYNNLRQTLKKIVGNNNDDWNKLYYARIQKGSDFRYAVLISNDEVNLFRPTSYFDVEGEEFQIIMRGDHFSGITITSDGSWAYSEAAITNSNGKVVGLLEMGFDMIGHDIVTTKQQHRIAFIIAITCIVILLAMSVIISIIVTNLRKITTSLKQIARGDYSVRADYSGKDEIGTVSRGLNNMTKKLNVQFEQLQVQLGHINKLNESTSRFVPTQFMEYLGVTDITKMNLGDNIQRDLTILFFDIRAFSVNSEMMSAKENFTFINKVLGISGPIIRQHNGFVDKYIGDAVMALFVNAVDAVEAGIEIYKQLVIDKTVVVGGDGINIGIGINSGSIMMGIIGEEERLSSTVISKHVNMASRLETLTKQTKSGMLITRDTLNKLSGVEHKFKYRFIGLIQAAGVNEVVGVFDMLDALPPATREIRLETKEIFESGIRNYHMKEYEIACERFHRVVETDPTDKCAMNYFDVSRKRLKDPTLPSVFTFSKK
jgi:class 3 adenylate cyclase/HAMP domain-containing protein